MTYGIVFIALVIAITIGFISYLSAYYDNDRMKAGYFGVLVSSICLTVILSIIACASYSSYLDLKIYKNGKYQQRIDAILEYDKIVSKHRGHNEITDMKFQGLQRSMENLIVTHRDFLTNYNSMVIGKRALSKNPFVGFLIFEPDDDMVVLPFIIIK